MRITALPPSTVRLLGSTVNIVSPVDVVKELIDNAIDAGAKSIEVSTSPNTLDRIQVRDDGHGIASTDFVSLAKAAHTSKLKSFEELHSRGGEILGFRGQALASTNALANVTVITKTTIDPVASRVKLRRGIGGVENRFPVSAPVGTSILISDLFDKFPARKQNLLKHAQKTIDGIKCLIKTYAFARRGEMRFKFKILGNPDSAWLYVPSADTTASSKSRLRDVIMQTFSKNLANACIYDVFEEPDAQKKSGIKLRAVLPSLDGDSAAWQGKGAFISVDARPLSVQYGTTKKIYTMFKAHLCKALSLGRVPPKPFMFLDMDCVPAMYDVNVATLKNDVLFADEPALLAQVKALLEKIYDGTAKIAEENRFTANAETAVPAVQNTQLSTRPPSATISDDSHIQESSHAKGPLPVSKQMKRSLHKSDEVASSSSVETLHGTALRMMRTKVTVNMERQDSNFTDDGNDQIQVRIPKRPLVDLKTEESSKKKPRLTDAARKFLGIERYLLPQNAEFEIATDDTATPASSATVNKDMRSKKVVTRPLQTLTQPQINRLNGQYESDIESEQHSDSDGYHTMQLTPQAIQQHILRTPTGQVIDADETSNELDILTAANVLAPRFEVLHTPPPSVPMRHEPGINSAQQFPSTPEMIRRRVSRGIAYSSGSQRNQHTNPTGNARPRVISAAMATPSNPHNVRLEDRTELRPVFVGPGTHASPIGEQQSQMNDYIQSPPVTQQRIGESSQSNEAALARCRYKQMMLMKSPSPPPSPSSSTLDLEYQAINGTSNPPLENATSRTFTLLSAVRLDVTEIWQYMICADIQEGYNVEGELQFKGLTPENVGEAEELQMRAKSTVDMWMKKWDASAEVEYSQGLVRLVKGKGRAMAL